MSWTKYNVEHHTQRMCKSKPIDFEVIGNKIIVFRKSGNIEGDITDFIGRNLVIACLNVLSYHAKIEQGYDVNYRYWVRPIGETKVLYDSFSALSDKIRKKQKGKRTE